MFNLLYGLWKELNFKGITKLNVILAEKKLNELVSNHDKHSIISLVMYKWHLNSHSFKGVEINFKD